MNLYCIVGKITVGVLACIGMALGGFIVYMRVEDWLWFRRHRRWCKTPPPEPPQVETLP